MLRLIANPRDHLAWRTRIELTDGLGASTVRAVYDFARQEGTFGDALRRLPEFSESVPAGCRSTLANLIGNTTTISEQSSETIQEQLTHPETATSENLMSSAMAVAEMEIAEEDGRAEIVSYLTALAEGSGCTTLEDLLMAIAIGPSETESELDPNSVNLLTKHQAKGLSADVVFIMAAEDEILPREQTATAIEDRRRLLYVSMTRARKQLIITYCSRRKGMQAHTGRSPGDPRRHLTRFLTSSSLEAEPGEAFVSAKALPS